jgi:hypothetical protein
VFVCIIGSCINCTTSISVDWRHLMRWSFLVGGVESVACKHLRIFLLRGFFGIVEDVCFSVILLAELALGPTDASVCGSFVLWPVII